MIIDDQLIANAKHALREAGIELVEHDVILATKAEARECFAKFKKLDDLDAVVLFSGTWVWGCRRFVLRHLGLGRPHDRRPP
jgi:hypothetical protein